MIKHADTNELLDRCHCTARAGFVKKTTGNTGFVQCSECAESTICYICSCDAMIDWNKKMRRIKKQERTS